MPGIRRLRLLLAVMAAVMTLLPFEPLSAAANQPEGCCEGRCFCRLMLNGDRHCHAAGAGDACLLKTPRAPANRHSNQSLMVSAARLGVAGAAGPAWADLQARRLPDTARPRLADPWIDSPTPPPRLLSAA